MTVEMCAGASLVSIYSKLIEGMLHFQTPMICHCGYFLMKVTVHTSLVAPANSSPESMRFRSADDRYKNQKIQAPTFIVRMRLRSLIVHKDVKCMEIRTNVRICPDFHTFLCRFFTFLNASISVKTSPINTKLGDFVNLGALFLTMWINSC